MLGLIYLYVVNLANLHILLRKKQLDGTAVGISDLPSWRYVHKYPPSGGKIIQSNNPGVLLFKWLAGWQVYNATSIY